MSAPSVLPRVIPEVLFEAASAPYVRYLCELKAIALGPPPCDPWAIVWKYNAMMAETKALCEPDGFTAADVILETHRRGKALKQALDEIDRRDDAKHR